AELMGGEIGVQSRPGRGATFWFTSKFEKQPAQPGGDWVVPESLRNKRILVVDDNQTNRLVLTEQLRSWGCCVEQATGGQQSLDKLRQAVTAGRREMKVMRFKRTHKRAVEYLNERMVEGYQAEAIL
ncbi:hypothetical protein D1BOALGB6SA_6767, partial [Olavius sp. associated proteobacterium Delta 1]